MKVAIYARQVNANNLLHFQTLFSELKILDAEVYLFSTVYNALKQHLKTIQFTVFSSAYEIKDKVDFLFSIGGDGTILDTVTLVQDSGIPVLGINTGRLGFLSSISHDNIASAVMNIHNGHYAVDRRSLLKLETTKKLFGDVNYALNELTIHKKDSSSMIIIHTFLNGEPLNSYWADGLIIATPTGSTGYSLSCGGPIVMPQSGNFVITPIAPHNLNVRPFVVSDKNVISLEVEGRSQFFLATLDSRSITIDNSIQLAVRRQDFTFNIIRLNDENFLGTLRKKLSWGMDSRNW